MFHNSRKDATQLNFKYFMRDNRFNVLYGYTYDGTSIITTDKDLFVKLKYEDTKRLKAKGIKVEDISYQLASKIQADTHLDNNVDTSFTFNEAIHDGFVGDFKTMNGTIILTSEKDNLLSDTLPNIYIPTIIAQHVQNYDDFIEEEVKFGFQTRNQLLSGKIPYTNVYATVNNQPLQLPNDNHYQRTAPAVTQKHIISDIATYLKENEDDFTL